MTMWEEGGVNIPGIAQNPHDCGYINAGPWIMNTLVMTIIYIVPGDIQFTLF